MHHQNVLGRDGAIGFQLETPVAPRVLQAHQRVRGTVNRALDLGYVQTA